MISPIFKNFRAFAAKMVVASLLTSNAVHAAVEFTEWYIPYNTDADTSDLEFGEFGPYYSNDPLRQHLHLYQLESPNPTPVFMFAHANGGTANSLAPDQLNDMIRAGYSVISWESVTYLDEGNPGGLDTCNEDFEAVWEWFQENAEAYNFDPNFVVIGGRSRGTVCSWTMAHSGKPGIQGIYMYNALPDGAWPVDVPREDTPWVTNVTESSPPLFLGYGPTCPKPIQQDCDTNGDIHNPKNGQTIVDRYEELGIGSKVYLLDGFARKGLRKFEKFPAFAQAIGSPTDGVSINATECWEKLSETCPKTTFESEIGSESMSAMTRGGGNGGCGQCAKSHSADLTVAGCSMSIVTRYCQRGTNSTRPHHDHVMNITDTCMTTFEDECGDLAQSSECGQCLKDNREDLSAAGCTVRAVTSLCRSGVPSFGEREDSLSDPSMSVSTLSEYSTVSLMERIELSGMGEEMDGMEWMSSAGLVGGKTSLAISLCASAAIYFAAIVGL